MRSENSILVVDTEVTGLDPELDRVVEIATVEVVKRKGTWSLGDTWSTLVNPEGRRISFGAMGTHHITEKMVAKRKPLRDAVPSGHLLRDPSLVRAAHFAAFDRNHVERDLPESRWICTYKCARRYIPDMESYRNMSLRYQLDIDVRGTGAHRALLDATVTAHILLRLLDLAPTEDLIRVTTEPVLLVTCEMGKHKGKTWEQISDEDPGYLRWILGKGPRRALDGGGFDGFDEDTRHTCQHWLVQRGLG